MKRETLVAEARLLSAQQGDRGPEQPFIKASIDHTEDVGATSPRKDPKLLSERGNLDCQRREEENNSGFQQQCNQPQQQHKADVDEQKNSTTV